MSIDNHLESSSSFRFFSLGRALATAAAIAIIAAISTPAFAGGNAIQQGGYVMMDGRRLVVEGNRLVDTETKQSYLMENAPGGFGILDNGRTVILDRSHNRRYQHQTRPVDPLETQIEEYKRLLAGDPDNEDYMNQLAKTYINNNRIDQGISYFHNLADSYLKFDWLASMYSRKKNFWEAAEAGRRGLRLNPNDPTLNYNLAVSLWHLDREKNGELILSLLRTARQNTSKPGFLADIAWYERELTN